MQATVITRKGTKQEFHFSQENIKMVKDLCASGLTHKQVAAKLAEKYVTSVNHKRITAKTISNCLYAERYFSPDYKVTPKHSRRDTGTIIDPQMLHSDEVQEIINSNLKKDLKLKLVSSLIN